MAGLTSAVDVFVNCPFDAEYEPMFRAIIFTVYACGFRVRTTKEVDDNSQTRIDKLYTLIGQSRYGIHDISRTELDIKHNLPRFNMPLELGLFLACKRFGGRAQAKKSALILDTQQFRFQKFLSDLAGMDIHSHRGQPKRVLVEVRNWLQNVSKKPLPSAKTVATLYADFRRKLPASLDDLGLDITKLDYVDFERLVTGYLTE